MKLRRLALTHFGGVREAALDFAPGLNILYGPNDLGKSTLAEAIRLVLLLQPKSTAAERWFPWTGGHKPTVELTFDTAPDAIYRVKKEFGTDRAALAMSRDGVAFEELARARAVDGELRKRLGWGIAEPGPAGQRGIPTSFLATALLSTQRHVDDVLALTLDADDTLDGRDQIAKALQAVAQDPLFTTIANEVTAKYESAYSPSGQRRKGAGSPYQRVADEVNARQREVDAAKGSVGDAEGLQARVGGLEAAWLAAQAAAAEAKAAWEAAGVAQEQRARHDAAQRAHAAAAAALRALDGWVGEHGVSVLKVEAAARAAAEWEEARRVAAEACTQARDARERAEETARAGLPSTEAEAERLRLAAEAAAAKIEAAARTIADVEAARALGVAAASAEAKEEAAEAAVGAAGTALVTAEAASELAIAARQRLDGVERALDLADREAELADAIAAAATEAELVRRREAEQEAQAARIAERAAIVVPERRRLAELRGLATQREGARRALDVGLAVTVTPEVALALGVDGGAPERVTEARTFEAETAITLHLPGVASIQIRGGSADARREVERLDAVWSAVAAPVLAAAGVTDLDGLDARLEAARALDAAVEQGTRALAELDARRAALGDVAGAVASRQAARDAAREGVDPAAFAADLVRLGPDRRAGLRRARADADRAVGDAAQQARLAQRAHAERAGERAAAVATRTAAIASRDAHPLLGADLGVLAATAAAARAAATAEQAAAKAGLTDLAAAGTAREGQLGQAVRAARAAEEAAEQAVAARTRDANAAAQAIGVAQGARDQLAAQVATQDRAALERALAGASAALAAAPAPAVEPDVAGMLIAYERAARAAAEAKTSVDQAHGALEQTGGAVARERLAEAEEALLLAQRHEAAVELEYHAWRLLKVTLTAAEQDQASHLGQALAPDVAARFGALTDARYGPVSLGPRLSTDGVGAGGGTRDAAHLSVGTRDQLATLFRITLASYLGSTVVLDDQLVQSDALRMERLRDVLAERASAAQIVVLTCRPEEYRVAGARFVDLTGVIRR